MGPHKEVFENRLTTIFFLSRDKSFGLTQPLTPITAHHYIWSISHNDNTINKYKFEVISQYPTWACDLPGWFSILGNRESIIS